MNGTDEKSIIGCFQRRCLLEWWSWGVCSWFMDQFLKRWVVSSESGLGWEQLAVCKEFYKLSPWFSLTLTIIRFSLVSYFIFSHFFRRNFAKTYCRYIVKELPGYSTNLHMIIPKLEVFKEILHTSDSHQKWQLWFMPPFWGSFDTKGVERDTQQRKTKTKKTLESWGKMYVSMRVILKFC